MANGFDYSANRTVDDIRYDGKLKMASWGAQIRLASHRPHGPLYLTAGLYSNGNKINAVAESVRDGHYRQFALYFSAKSARSTPAASSDSAAPYLGIGGRLGGPRQSIPHALKPA